MLSLLGAIFITARKYPLCRFAESWPLGRLVGNNRCFTAIMSKTMTFVSISCHTIPKVPKGVTKHVAYLESKGDVVVMRAMIEPEAFLKWCKDHGMLPDAKARMRFAQRSRPKTS
jgi:hypothetical protein